MSHANISIFVPHLGCPNRCSFCDQNIITGTVKLPNGEDIENAVNTAKLSSNFDPHNTELAFFGGSFTAIDREYMLELLESSYEFVKSGDISGIRISTRPDCIDTEVLGVLKQYGVSAIELGAQSMCDDVLKANNRGHNAEDVKKASELIKSFRFRLGLQMMTGLYKSTYEIDKFTAQEIVKLKPDTVRIYPTITLSGTQLESLVKSGEYIPPTLEDTVQLCAELLDLFELHNIKVIRTGLHTIEQSRYVAGPWHPAFRELCDSKRYYNKVIKLLPQKGEYILHVNPKEISKVTGNKKANILNLEESGYKVSVKGDDSLEPMQVTFERMNNSCF